MTKSAFALPNFWIGIRKPIEKKNKIKTYTRGLDNDNQKKNGKNKIENTWQVKDIGTHQRKDKNRYKLPTKFVFPYSTNDLSSLPLMNVSALSESVKQTKLEMVQTISQSCESLDSFVHWIKHCRSLKKKCCFKAKKHKIIPWKKKIPSSQTKVML